jgi:hypothetical protein
VPFVNAQASFVAATGVLTLDQAGGGGADQDLYGRVRIGDTIRITDNVAVGGVFTSFDVEVLAFTTLRIIQCTQAAPGAINVANGAFTSIVVLEGGRPRKALSTRRVMANGVRHRLSVHLPLPIFETSTYFPLPLLAGMGPLQIEIEFHRAQEFLYVGEAAADNKIGYQVITPRLCCRMVQPVKMIVDSHKMVSKTSGFLFYYKDWRHFMNQALTNTNHNLQIQTNFYSVHGIITVLTDATRADTNGTTSQNYKSQSSFRRSALKLYRYTIGGRHYPSYDYARLDLSTGGNPDTFAIQAYKQYEMMLGVDAKWSSPSIEPYEWRDADSTKFILSAPMSTYDKYNCGVQISNSAVELDLQRVTAPGITENVHSWIYHDCILQIGDNKVNVFR